jgi:hypothetical protein
MTTVSKEIVDSILSKDNFFANEKIYDALYGKSSEQLQTRKVEIAKHFFDPDQHQDNESSPESETPEASVNSEEPEKQETEETPEQ